MDQIIPMQRRRESLGWLEVLSRIASMLTIDPNPEIPDLRVAIMPHPHDPTRGKIWIELSGNFYEGDRDRIREARIALHDYLQEVKPDGWELEA